jgi:hypothetical protein
LRLIKQDIGESRLSPWPPKKYTETFSAKASQQKLRHS